MKSLLPTLLLLALLAAAPAKANDTFAEISLGGLVMTKSDEISLDREELFMSENEVRVDYLFTNTGAEDIEALVAFPLPDQDPGSETVNFHDLEKTLDFRTAVDGKPVQYEIVVQAIVDGKDVTAELAPFGFNPRQDWNAFDAALRALSPERRAEALKRGLIRDISMNPGDGFYQPAWLSRTIVSRKQLFPAGKTIAVSHRYRPLPGGRVGGFLSPRDVSSRAFRETQAKYCIDDAWLAALDQAVAKQKRKKPGVDACYLYWETWLNYVLKTGANWKGRIRDFRLVVDKGKPENLVSFCAEGVKKISPTEFEVRKTNFEPKQDLSILIVSWRDDQP